MKQFFPSVSILKNRSGEKQLFAAAALR